MNEEIKVLGRKPLMIKNVTPECHQKLKIYSAITEKPQADALDEALTIAINAKRKRLIDVFSNIDLSDETVLAGLPD
jgi:hypothetical protein